MFVIRDAFSEAVTVSNVIAIASLVSEIGLATERKTHTDTQTHRDTVSVTAFREVFKVDDFGCTKLWTFPNRTVCILQLF